MIASSFGFKGIFLDLKYAPSVRIKSNREIIGRRI